MELDLVINNFLSPPILFFILGIIVVLVKSDLKIPDSIQKFLSLYLLLAIGFNGGAELRYAEHFSRETILTFAAAIVMALLVPVYSFFILRKKIDVFNSAAIAATYGSVSIVTFITACMFLKKMDIEFGGHMVAMLALMESPAIVMGVLFARLFSKEERSKKFSFLSLLRESFTSGPVLVITGSFIIGMFASADGKESLAPFTSGIFRGMLVIFLLDLGMLAAREARHIYQAGVFLISFAFFMPIVNALLGILLAYVSGFGPGNAFLFSILCASASYIAVPAAMRLSVPQANPGLYVCLSLGITFPFNILVGIPGYFYIINKIWSL